MKPISSLIYPGFRHLPCLFLFFLSRKVNMSSASAQEHRWVLLVGTGWISSARFQDSFSRRKV
ncbi:hypothetical protein M378DRAFT_921677 [Amanita muscaria Koide BX008]|uniref:Uncharacterized protein n=1 Tax=Amanita muscaria (strain Koide BX008) TaxID=946122 RepID=A0A0C2T1V2_AMAMK|nr:hypothetical protein M378DRAFT_921677 [Amanita muscaria Koide BX008]